MEYFLATGNLVSKTGLGLMQVSRDVMPVVICVVNLNAV